MSPHATARADPTGWNWDQARRRCLLVARRLAACEDEAQDIAQEAVVRAWRHRHSARDASGQGAWLAQITRNEAARHFSRRRMASISDHVDHEPADDGLLQTSVDRLDVQRALVALDPQDRLMVLLRYREDLTQPRIAELLGIPEGTVKVRLHRLRKQLSATLGDPA